MDVLREIAGLLPSLRVPFLVFLWFFCSVSILTTRHGPRFKTAWIVILTVTPVFGAIAYYCIGKDMPARRKA